MPDTPTPKRGFLRPKLGKRPWKSEWDTNWLKADNDIGGLIDGSIPAGAASEVTGTWYVAHILQLSGTLDIGGLIDDGVHQDIRVDHISAGVFDLPGEPIFTITTPSVHAVLLYERSLVSVNERGGVFVVRIENNSGSSFDPSTVTWSRKGWKFA